MEDKQITLQIDGHFITVPEGSTILEAATKIGINIPTLCHIDLKGTCIKNNPASCPQSGSRAYSLRPSQRLSHLSQMRQLRASDTGVTLQHP